MKNITSILLLCIVSFVAHAESSANPVEYAYSFGSAKESAIEPPEWLHGEWVVADAGTGLYWPISFDERKITVKMVGSKELIINRAVYEVMDDSTYSVVLSFPAEGEADNLYSYRFSRSGGKVSASFSRLTVSLDFENSEMRRLE